MSEINSKTKDILDKWSKKLEIDPQYTEEAFLKFLETEKDEKKARLKTIGKLQEEFGSVISNAPWFFTYLLDESGIVDIFELMRQKSINWYNDPERHDNALNQGMITEDGTPLDYREKVLGKLNEKKGLPLTGHSYLRTFFGIVSSTEDFNSPIIAEMIASGDFAKTLNNIEVKKFYKFRGNQNRKNPSRINLGISTKFIQIDPKITSREIAEKINSIPIDQIEDDYKNNFAGKKNVSYVCPLRGGVTYLSLEPVKEHRIFVLTDEDSGAQIRCRIHESVPISFSVSDELLTFNRLYSDRNGKIGAQLKAYMVI